MSIGGTRPLPHLQHGGLDPWTKPSACHIFFCSFPESSALGGVGVVLEYTDILLFHQHSERHTRLVAPKSFPWTLVAQSANLLAPTRPSSATIGMPVGRVAWMQLPSIACWGLSSSFTPNARTRGKGLSLKHLGECIIERSVFLLQAQGGSCLKRTRAHRPHRGCPRRLKRE
jgi:hypothetical protein